MLAAITLTAAAAAAAGPAAASPLTYLQCTTFQNGKPKEWTITLNEGEGVVDYDTAISGQQRRPARFTAEAVYFIGFTLSRVDLSIKRVIEFGGEVTGTETGTCRLSKPKTRAF